MSIAKKSQSTLLLLKPFHLSNQEPLPEHRPKLLDRRLGLQVLKPA